MNRFFGLELALVVALSGVLLVGCGDKDATEPPADDAPVAEEPATDGAAAVDPAQAEINEALAALPEEDQQAAREQAICPVSKEPLGSMGTPIKITVDDREVFVCCEGCKKPVQENPEEYLANLSTS